MVHKSKMGATMTLSENESGFTLVELVVVALLLGMLSAVLFGTVNGIIRSKQLVEEQSKFDRTAQYALGRMMEELSARFPSPIQLAAPAGEGELEEDELDPGEEGDTAAAVRKQFLLGINKKDRDHDTDSLTFVSAKGGQAYFGARENHGLVVLTYSVREGKRKGEKSIDTSDGTETVALVREERPLAAQRDLQIEREVIFPLAQNVWSLNFRYLEDGDWVDAWDAGKSGFPQAVEITLVLGTDENNLQKYRTAIAVDFPSPATGNMRIS